jgi:hypothetical protein
VVDRDGHVQERDALRHRELELVDFERRHVYVVGSCGRSETRVVEGGLLDHALPGQVFEREDRNEGVLAPSGL